MIDVEALLDESVTDPDRCQTCNWLKARPAEERKKWEDSLAQPKTFSAVVVARAMGKAMQKIDSANHPPSPTMGSVRNHRGGHGSGRGPGVTR